MVPAITQIAWDEKPRFDPKWTPALPRILVMAPTRELALQINVEARKLVFNGKIQCVCIYGGQSVKDQLKQLANGVDIVRLVLFISRSFSRA